MSARVILTPFASLGDRYSIPDTDTNDNVSISKGFTPIYSTPISKGGKPPSREEFNGIFYLIYEHLYDRQTGLTPTYDNRLNYQKFCIVKSNDDKIYICIKENGPDTPYGIKVPENNPTYWTINNGSNVDELQTKLGEIENKLNTHVEDKNNPHEVTKTQVGLGNLPNKVTNNYNLNDQNTLASAKAVHDLYIYLTNNLNRIDELLEVIKKLKGHIFDIDEDGNLIFDGNVVTGGSSGEIVPKLHNNQTTFLTVNEKDPGFNDAINRLNLKDASLFTVCEGTVSPENVKDDGIRAVGFVTVNEENPGFEQKVDDAKFANGGVITVAEGEEDLSNEGVSIDDIYVGYVEDTDPESSLFEEKVDALNLNNGGAFTIVNKK